MKYTQIAGAVAVVLLASACSTTKVAEAPKPAPAPVVTSPTPPVVADQPIRVPGRVTDPQTIDLPSWYIKPPASSDDYVFVAGTGISDNLSMSRNKATLDAQRQLADMINTTVNALTKQHQQDNHGTTTADRTSVTIKKISSADITGMMVEDSKIMKENGLYRSFVLLRYPVADANRLLKDKRQQERMDRDGLDISDHELEQELEKARQAKARPVTAVTTVDIK